MHYPRATYSQNMDRDLAASEDSSLTVLQAHTAPSTADSLSLKIDLINHFIEEQVDGIFGVHVDQDWFVAWLPGLNLDRNYTQGTAFSYTKPGLEKSPIFLPFNIFEWVGERTIGKRKLIEKPPSISIAISAYTPLDIDKDDPVIGDRPFANLVYLSTKKNRYNVRNRTLLSTSFNYGIMGSAVADVFQTFVHDNIITKRSADISWEHQISDGGHFAFLFTHGALKSFSCVTKACSSKKWRAGMSLGYDLKVGWYTGISAMINLKLGPMSAVSMGPGLPDTPLHYSDLGFDPEVMQALTKDKEQLTGIGPTNHQELVSTMFDNVLKTMNVYGSEQKKFEWYFFTSVQPHMVPYNSLLLGQPHVTSQYTLENDNYIPLFLDLEYGVVFNWYRWFEDIDWAATRAQVLLSLNHRSPEIRAREFQRWHHWGRVTIQFPFF